MKRLRCLIFGHQFIKMRSVQTIELPRFSKPEPNLGSMSVETVACHKCGLELPFMVKIKADGYDLFGPMTGQWCHNRYPRE